MKVYRIKHKPSGLYWNKYINKLDENGCVFDLYALAKNILSMMSLKYHKQYHPSEFEIKEYEIKD